MNEERFRALAAAYGGELSRWPYAERAQARAFAAREAEAAALILEDCSALDRVLATAPVAIAHAAFVSQALKGVPNIHSAQNIYDARAAGFWTQLLAGVFGDALGGSGALSWRPTVAALAVLGLIGFTAGWASGPILLDAGESDAFASVSYDSASYFDLEEADG